MQDKPKHGGANLLIVLAILIGIGVAGYMYITRDTSSSDLLVATDPSVAPVDNQLLAALRDLRRLKLDDSIFKDAVWLSLQDFGQTLAPQDPYRPNPFAPIGSGVTAVQQPASTTQQ
ncbi:MAG TPA: hypothetical protein VGE35_01140 [Candidatus Paceibacterota bacterium]